MAARLHSRGIRKATAWMLLASALPLAVVCPAAATCVAESHSPHIVLQMLPHPCGEHGHAPEGGPHDPAEGHDVGPCDGHDCCTDVPAVEAFEPTPSGQRVAAEPSECAILSVVPPWLLRPLPCGPFDERPVGADQVLLATRRLLI